MLGPCARPIVWGSSSFIQRVFVSAFVRSAGLFVSGSSARAPWATFSPAAAVALFLEAGAEQSPTEAGDPLVSPVPGPELLPRTQGPSQPQPHPGWSGAGPQVTNPSAAPARPRGASWGRGGGSTGDSEPVSRGGGVFAPGPCWTGAGPAGPQGELWRPCCPPGSSGVAFFTSVTQEAESHCPGATVPSALRPNSSARRDRDLEGQWREALGWPLLAPGGNPAGPRLRGSRGGARWGDAAGWNGAG